MEEPTSTPAERSPVTFQTGEGKGAVGTIVLGFLTLAAQKADLVALDATDRHLLIGGMFAVACALIVSRGLSKNGTGF